MLEQRYENYWLDLAREEQEKERREEIQKLLNAILDAITMPIKP